MGSVGPASRSGPTLSTAAYLWDSRHQVDPPCFKMETILPYHLDNIAAAQNSLHVFSENILPFVEINLKKPRQFRVCVHWQLFLLWQCLLSIQIQCSVLTVLTEHCKNTLSAQIFSCYAHSALTWKQFSWNGNAFLCVTALSPPNQYLKVIGLMTWVTTVEKLFLPVTNKPVIYDLRGCCL